MRRVPPLAAALVAVILAACAAQPPTLPQLAEMTLHEPGARADAVGNIARGPYLQHADAGVTVAWYSEHAGQGRLHWRSEDGSRGEADATSSDGIRHEAVIGSLHPGQRTTYRISSSEGPLAGVGGRMDYSFQAPEPGVLRFVVFGDSGVGPPTQQAVADAIAREPVLPDLVMIAGDVMQPPSDAGSYTPKFFGPYSALLPAVPFYAAVGNHDDEVDGAQPLFDVFTLPRNGPPGLRPESVYFLERAGVQMIVHDSNRTPALVRDHAAPWHRELARRPATFRLAVQHHTMYSSGPNGKAQARDVLAQLFSSTGTDVVFNGHDHFYERTWPVGGVVYVTVGTGGGSLYARTANNPTTAAFANDRHGYTFVEVRGRTLHSRQMDTDGRTVDSFSLSKPVSSADWLETSSASASDDSSRHFEVAEPAAVDVALLRVLGAGPFTARVNGVEVGPAGGLIGPTTVELPAVLLRAGDNGVSVDDPRQPGLPGPRFELSLLGRSETTTTH